MLILLDVVLLAATAAGCVHLLRETADISRTVVTKMPPNTDRDAKAAVQALVAEAQHSLWMYDDGDPETESLYQNEAFVQAIQSKLAENKNFKVECLLNYPTGTTLFERELSNVNGVQIRKRVRNRSRTHYKIIDGRKAYVSRHRRRHKTRYRKLIDCSRSRKNLAIQPYIKDFENAGVA